MIDHHVAAQIVLKYPWPARVPRPHFCAGRTREGKALVYFTTGGASLALEGHTPEAALRYAILEWCARHGHKVDPSTVRQLHN